MSNDSLVRCSVCEVIKKVDFGYCLENGWPKCCGVTMRLINSSANVSEVADRVISAQTKVRSK